MKNYFSDEKRKELWSKTKIVLKKVGKILLCCAVAVSCITGGILLAEYAGERAPFVRTALFDLIENTSTGIREFFGGKPAPAEVEQPPDEGIADALQESPAEDVPEETYEQLLCRQVREMVEQQAELERLILEELHSGAYTFEKPFVLLDPYGVSPLTALVLFTTEEPVRIDIHIAGDTPEADVDFSFSEYDTEHMVPIYGLYPNRLNQVTITATDQAGKTRSTTVEVQTGVLPVTLSETLIQAHTYQPEKVQPGFTFTHFNGKTAIDVNGDYRWYLNIYDAGTLFEKVLRYCSDYNDGQSLYLSCGTNNAHGSVLLMETNLLGKIFNVWYSPYGIHHELDFDETGLVAAGYFTDYRFEGFIYHIDRETGEIDRTFNYKDILQVMRNQNIPSWTQWYGREDWMHLNAIVPYEGDVIVSSRNQSTVLRNDWEGNIKWMLCDPTGYYEYYQQYILKPIGDNFRYCYGQHAPEVMPDQDGNPDTIDILLFDNGDFHPAIEERTSQMIQYRINEKEMTVEVVWIWGDDKPELYSNYHGDADLLENGNRLGSFQPLDHLLTLTHAYAAEVDADGNLVWDMWRMKDTTSYDAYRLDRLPIYTETANDLHIGEPASLHLPQ